MAEAPVRGAKLKARTILLVVLAAVATFVVAAFGAWGLFVGFERPVETRDREVFVTFERLAEKVEGIAKVQYSEKSTRKVYLDGTYEVAYEYDGGILSIDSSANHERSAKDARQLFALVRLAVPAAAKVTSNVEFVPRSDLFGGGDDRYCSAIHTGGVPAGHVLVVLDGKNVFTLMIGGAFLDSPADFQALVQPRLDALKRLH